MGLEKPSLYHTQICFLIGFPDQLCLLIFAGLCKTSNCPAVLISTCGSYQCSDVISVFDCLTGRLQDKHPEAFSSGVAIRAVVKALTPASGRQEAHLGKRNVHFDRADQIHTSHDRLQTN